MAPPNRAAWIGKLNPHEHQRSHCSHKIAEIYLIIPGMAIAFLGKFLEAGKAGDTSGCHDSGREAG